MFKWGIFRGAFVVMSCLSMMALANEPSLHDDLVGDWLCVAKRDLARHTAIMRYHADGTATEMREGTHEYLGYNAAEMMLIHYRWSARGDRLYMSDYELPNYAYYHQYHGKPLSSDEAITEAMRGSVLGSLNEHNWHHVTFDGKDRHHAAFEDGFMGDCKRLK